MEGTSHFFPLVSSFISFGKIKWNGDIPRIYSCALPFSSSFSETKEEDGKEEAFSFLIPFLFRELEGERREEEKREAGKTPGYRPIVGIYRSLLWVLSIHFYDIKNAEENQEN